MCLNNISSRTPDLLAACVMCLNNISSRTSELLAACVMCLNNISSRTSELFAACVMCLNDISSRTPELLAAYVMCLNIVSWRSSERLRLVYYTWISSVPHRRCTVRVWRQFPPSNDSQCHQRQPFPVRMPVFRSADLSMIRIVSSSCTVCTEVDGSTWSNANGQPTDTDGGDLLWQLIYESFSDALSSSDYQTGGCKGNGLDLYSEGAWLETQSWHQLSWLRVLWPSSAPLANSRTVPRTGHCRFLPNACHPIIRHCVGSMSKSSLNRGGLGWLAVSE
jgi:hypothetical protein